MIGDVDIKRRDGEGILKQNHVLDDGGWLEHPVNSVVASNIRTESGQGCDWGKYSTLT